ncbi:MAG TPA: hypothetical protein VK251_09250 [Steroidobacteraceae bacterium]|nr:hypothetical protein [Steroidobacteraceae bacterium]
MQSNGEIQGYYDRSRQLGERQDDAGESPAYLDLDGPRWVFRSDAAQAYPELRKALNNWLL